MTVGEMAEAEQLMPIPLQPYPSTVEVERPVGDSALVAFRGNLYGVHPGLVRTTVQVRHRLGTDSISIVSPSGVVAAEYRLAPSGAGVIQRLPELRAALESQVYSSEVLRETVLVTCPASQLRRSWLCQAAASASSSPARSLQARPAHHQVSAAQWIASRKLPNRRRIVFSDGRMAASVQLSAVGSEPCSATNLRRAATDSAIRVSATSDSGIGSPSNRPGGFALWELRSTKFLNAKSAPTAPPRVRLATYAAYLKVLADAELDWNQEAADVVGEPPTN